jgi:hypothetical protein
MKVDEFFDSKRWKVDAADDFEEDKRKVGCGWRG